MLEYDVKPISINTAKPWVNIKHYAKRMPSNIINLYGLYYRKIIRGIILFGKSGNINLNRIEKYDLLELQRLIIDEGLRKNTSSWFISQTFKLLKKPLFLISYADENVSHYGYIYQATNWIYTGTSFEDIVVIDNKQVHRKTLYDQYGTSSRKFLKNKFGEKIEFIKAKPKHRYFYILSENKSQKKQMKNILLSKYKNMKYPKGKSERYDTTENFPRQVELF